LADRLDALAATGLPPSVVHGDLHTGNYVVGPDGVLLFDWTDAALGHPVLDAVLLAGSAGRANPALEQATLEAYAEVWRAARPDVGIDTALTLAPEVGLAYQAVSYDALVRVQEDKSQWDGPRRPRVPAAAARARRLRLPSPLSRAPAGSAGTSSCGAPDPPARTPR
jgi:aminoglycoside phosphotransferase (APT) family kinase protein